MKDKSFHEYICPTSIDIKPFEGQKTCYEERFMITTHIEWTFTIVT